jgi:cell wall assembly regulator SMI1
MQQFTRSLTREIEVGGERLAVTLSKEGLSVRPVGGRRPPHDMSWEAVLCACVAGAAGPPPSAEQLEEAIKAVRAGGSKPKEGATSPGEAAPPAAPPAPAPAAAPAASSAPAGHSLKELLGRVDHWLGAHRARFQHGLKPGASTADCDTLAATLGKPLPEELRTWLTWHDGQSADVPGAFEQSFNLMSAQEMTDAKKEIESQPHDGWQSSWVPFLEDDNGNYLCLDLASPGCPVRECWRGRADHPVAAPSLAAWVEQFVAGLERGDYTEDPERGTFHRRG